MLLALPLLAASPAQFAEHTVATGLRGGYQVVIADLNHDGRPDLIALASGMPELVWFENPGWERHVIAGGFTQHDQPRGSREWARRRHSRYRARQRFLERSRQKRGRGQRVEHNGDPREPWTITEIDRLTTSHRIRTADMDGSGKRIVIDAAADWGQGGAARISRPDAAGFLSPRRVETRRQSRPENFGLVHGLYIVDWDGDGRDEILTCRLRGNSSFQAWQGRRLDPH